jgi:hypothetical protein
LSAVVPANISRAAAGSSGLTSSSMPRMSGVSTGPGQMQFARIGICAHSSATLRVRPSRPCLEAV